MLGKIKSSELLTESTRSTLVHAKLSTYLLEKFEVHVRANRPTTIFKNMGGGIPRRVRSSCSNGLAYLNDSYWELCARHLDRMLPVDASLLDTLVKATWCHAVRVS